MLKRDSEEYQQHLKRFYGFSEEMVQRIVEGTGCGVTIGKGWLPMVIELDKQLAELHPDYKIDQIKEKFGGLRYYVSGVNSEAGQKLISDAESKSYEICDKCGEPGELRRGMWLRTLCDKHYEESKKG